jgi:dynein heavy chain
LKNKIDDDSTIEELPEKGSNNKQLDEKTQVFADLGFPSYISYGHRSMIRSEFMRFLRFAYLLDFIVT